MYQPEKIIKSKLNQLYTDNKNLLVDVFQKADAWILWFIGFVIGSLALFAGNLDKFSNRLTDNQVHVIFVSLFISAITGVLFRYIYIWFYLHLLKNIYSRFLNDFNSEFDFPEVRPLSGKETFEELIVLLNTSTGESFNNFLQVFADLEDDKRVRLCLTLINYYNQVQSLYEQKKEKGLNYVKERLEIYFGKSIEELMKKDKSSNRLYNSWFYFIVTLGSLLFLTLLISFGIALYTFCFKLHM